MLLGVLLRNSMVLFFTMGYDQIIWGKFTSSDLIVAHGEVKHLISYRYDGHIDKASHTSNGLIVALGEEKHSLCRPVWCLEETLSGGVFSQVLENVSACGNQKKLLHFSRKKKQFQEMLREIKPNIFSRIFFFSKLTWIRILRRPVTCLKSFLNVVQKISYFMAN